MLKFIFVKKFICQGCQRLAIKKPENPYQLSCIYIYINNRGYTVYIIIKTSPNAFTGQDTFIHRSNFNFVRVLFEI